MIGLGVIGGSGLYRMDELAAVREEAVTTPFGEPSDRFLVGRIGGREVAFLARHGRGHRLLPTEINFRANIFGFRLLGVERIVSISAVGSLREELRPLDVVLPDQFIDWTRQRPSTFFGGGVVAHVSIADPVCAALAGTLEEASRAAGARTHRGGTYLCIEGPQFSTRAESHLYRSVRADLVGMTNMQEVKLAREAGMCYATVAMVTDYDCWREGSEPVSVEEVVARLHENARVAQAIVREAGARLPEARACACARALDNAILTERALIPPETRARLRPLVGRRLD